MEYFNYKGGCGVCEGKHIETFKEELSCVIDKWLWLIIIINIMLFKTVIQILYTVCKSLNVKYISSINGII